MCGAALTQNDACKNLKSPCISSNLNRHWVQLTDKYKLKTDQYNCWTVCINLHNLELQMFQTYTYASLLLLLAQIVYAFWETTRNTDIRHKTFNRLFPNAKRWGFSDYCRNPFNCEFFWTHIYLTPLLWKFSLISSPAWIQYTSVTDR